MPLLAYLFANIHRLVLPNSRFSSLQLNLTLLFLLMLVLFHWFVSFLYPRLGSLRFRLGSNHRQGACAPKYNTITWCMPSVLLSYLLVYRYNNWEIFIHTRTYYVSYKQTLRTHECASLCLRICLSIFFGIYEFDGNSQKVNFISPLPLYVFINLLLANHVNAFYCIYGGSKLKR